MSTHENKKPVVWTLENTELDVSDDEVWPPFRSVQTENGPGTFRIRHSQATVAAGLDVVGKWEIDAVYGLTILNLELAPSQYVTDGCPEGRVRLRVMDGSEWPRPGIRFDDLKRLRVSQVREVIQRKMDQSLSSGFFHVSPEAAAIPLIARQLEVVEAAIGDRAKTGRPTFTESQLDRWAKDVMACLPDQSRPLYEQLAELWDVEETTVKNTRLPRLRATLRLTGKGRQMVRGPNFPRDKETDNG